MALTSHKAFTFAIKRAAPRRASPTGRRARATARSSSPAPRLEAEVSPAPDDGAADLVALSGALAGVDEDAAVVAEDEAGVAPDAVAPRPRRARDAGTYLSMYFRDMAALDVLRPEEEFTAAREIETLEIMLWNQFLAYPMMVEHVLDVVEACLDNALVDFRALRRAAAVARKARNGKTAQSQYARTAKKVAEKLRALDTDRVYADAVLVELTRLGAGVPSRGVDEKLGFSPQHRLFVEYLRRVQGAQRAAAEARNDFVKANLRLVVSIARRFNHGRMALADLIQEGNLGLIKAVERYDYRRGFRFSTYASWWIRHAISRALADKGREVRLPVHMIDAHHRLAKARRELTAKLGRQPTSDDLAEATGIPADKIEKMRTYLIDQSVSIDRPVNDEEGRNMAEFLQDPHAEDASPTEGLETESMTSELHHLLRELKPIEADILRRRFGLDDDKELTLKEIGEEYNLSRERIRQLQEQALAKMRRALQRKEIG